MAVLGKPNPNESYQALFERAKRARLAFDKECWLNVMFYMNEQYVEWSDAANTIRRIPRPQGMENAPRPVSNKIRHFVLQEHAMVLQTRPTVDVLPASDDPLDISNANVANAYLTWLTEPQVADWNGELAIGAMWALAGTEAYHKWVWNPRLDGGKGRPDIIACSPLDIYPDPYATKFHSNRYIIHSQFMDTEQVYDIYGIEVKASDVDKADPTRVAMQREMGMAPILQGCLVNELWMKPNRRYPEGLFVVWTHHTQLVEPQKFPYAHGRLPFTQIGSVPRPGSQHFTSSVSTMRPLQMELNKYHAQRIKIREAFANPKWWLPSELELESDPDDSPNQILRGNSNGGQMEPKLIAPPTFMQGDEGQWIRQEMMDSVGLHEVSQAQVPGRVEAAKAIELLKESDDGRLQELLRTISVAISEGYYQALLLTKQYGNDQMVFQTYSREGMPEVKRFRREQLHAGMRIKVTMGTGLARSRAARNDQLMLMWQNGIVQDRELMAELMDMPISSVSPDNMYDIKLARNENFTMAEGAPVVPNSWDNHDLHKREHNNYRKTQEYQQRPDKVKQMFEMHCQEHDKLQIQQLGKQLQIQSLAAQVAQGAGFQQQPGQAAAEGAQPPAGEGEPGQAPPPGPGAAAPPPGQVPIPNAMGAHPPPDPFAVRDSAQGQASYQDRYERNLHGLKP